MNHESFVQQQKQFRETFAADLRRYRLTQKKFSFPILLVMLLGFAAIIGAFSVSPSPLKWLLATGFFLIAAGIAAIAVAASSLEKKLLCPACHRQFIDDLAGHCPECGAAPLEPPDSILGARECSACGKRLVVGKNRNFRYKACTHCGTVLDDKGL